MDIANKITLLVRRNNIKNPFSQPIILSLILIFFNIIKLLK